MKIKVRNNNVESALRIFKRNASETIFECKEREYFEKPSAKRHKAKKAAISREQKRQKAQELNHGTYKKHKF